MSNEVIAAIVAAVFSLVSVVLSISTKFSLERRTRRETRQAFMEQYRGPLLHAAYNLQSRLYNILDGKVLHSGEGGREHAYFVLNTAYVVAQYMAWAEIIRREIFQLDLGEAEANRSLSRLLDNMYEHWQAGDSSSTLRLFAGEQRAVGEAMLVRDAVKGDRQVLGYGEFSRQLDSIPFIGEFRKELDQPDAVRDARPRLLTVQHTLVDLVNLLDPGSVYFPAEKLSKA